MSCWRASPHTSSHLRLGTRFSALMGTSGTPNGTCSVRFAAVAWRSYPPSRACTTGRCPESTAANNEHVTSTPSERRLRSTPKQGAARAVCGVEGDTRSTLVRAAAIWRRSASVFVRNICKGLTPSYVRRSPLQTGYFLIFAVLTWALALITPMSGIGVSPLTS